MKLFTKLLDRLGGGVSGPPDPPIAPTGVRVQGVDGTEVPVHVEFAGVDDNMNIYRGTVRNTELYEQVSSGQASFTLMADMLPPHTGIRLDLREQQ